MSPAAWSGAEGVCCLDQTSCVTLCLAAGRTTSLLAQPTARIYDRLPALSLHARVVNTATGELPRT